MAKSILKTAVEFLSIPQRFKAARTAADFNAVIAELDTQIREATMARDRIEDERPTVILNGEDPADFSRRLFEATDRVKTLQANRDEATRKRSEARQQEATSDLEERAGKVRTASEAAMQDSLRGIHTALDAISEYSRTYRDHERSVRGMNGEVRNRQRPDLEVDLHLIRQNALAELRGSAARTEEIEAPTPPVRKPVARQQGESDEYYKQRDEIAWQDQLSVYERQLELRRLNASAKADRAESLGDPLKVAWERAEKAAFDICNPMDPTERARNRRIVNIQSFRNSDGGGVRKVQANDGVAAAVYRGRPTSGDAA